MIIKISNSILMSLVLVLLSCSVHERFIYSAVTINGKVVNKWPYTNGDLLLHIRADNTQAIQSKSKIFGIPVENSDGPRVTSLRPHTFFIAIKAQPGRVISLESTKFELVYNDIVINLYEVSYPKLIAYDAPCIEISGTLTSPVLIQHEQYFCIQLVFAIDTIAPTESFQLTLNGLVVNGKHLPPLIFNFQGSERKSIRM